MSYLLIGKEKITCKMATNTVLKQKELQKFIKESSKINCDKNEQLIDCKVSNTLEESSSS